jgi:hypothetical protein
MLGHVTLMGHEQQRYIHTLTVELNAGDRFDTKGQCWETFQWLVQKEAMK